MGKANISGSMWSPILWVVMKNPYQGSQTPVYIAAEPSLKDTTGEYFRFVFVFQFIKLQYGNDTSGFRY